MERLCFSFDSCLTECFFLKNLSIFNPPRLICALGCEGHGVEAGFLGALGCLVGITGGERGHQPSALGTALAIYKRTSIRDAIEAQKQKKTDLLQ